MSPSEVELLVDLICSSEEITIKVDKVFDFICDLFDLANEVEGTNTSDLVHRVIQQNLLIKLAEEGLDSMERKKKFMELIESVLCG
jgi:hypothetical protein